LLNFELFGWACGSLLFSFLMLVWGRVRRDGLMWAWILLVWVAMSLYWFSGGPDFGPRYWAQVMVPVTVLTLRGAQAVAGRLGMYITPELAQQRVFGLVAIASLLALVNVLPWRSLDKYHNYRGIRPDVRALQSENDFGRSLVLVRGPSWPDYASAATFNPPTYDRDAAGTIYARDLDQQSRERLRRYYADRPVWVLAGPSETGNEFLILEKP
jgi:hypothetical protein